MRNISHSFRFYCLLCVLIALSSSALVFANFAYVANNDSDTVSVIDASNNSVVGSISVGIGSVWIAITPNGRFAYVTNGSDDTVSVVDTSSNSVVRSISVDSQPTQVAIMPSGTFAYVTSEANDRVFVIDTSSMLWEVLQ